MPRKCPECGWIWPKPTGPCPACGSGDAPETKLMDTPVFDGAEAKAPWHLKLLLGALGVYLSWRFLQMAGWIADRF